MENLTVHRVHYTAENVCSAYWLSVLTNLYASKWLFLPAMKFLQFESYIGRFQSTMMSVMALSLQYVAFSLIAYLQSQQAERILSSLPCVWILTSWPSRGSLKRETAWETHCIWHSQEVKERAKQKSIQDWILWYFPPSPNSFKNKAQEGRTHKSTPECLRLSE